ncbi:MAG: RNA methyltransferase [Roseburia sp.]|nr:RNA methyltransferase [Anaeroplasma bactoclasticum]MCM1196578.1 RNA methyltransferase [Roseburia sp.]MCM1557100.1 RNA methyltransferase [Anaeroplasma bactoclasticum]
MISSLDNPKIKKLLKLKQTKYRKQVQMFLVEGSHLVLEARLAGVLIEAYSIEDKAGYIQVSETIMKKIGNTDTVVKEIGLCSMLFKSEITDKVLILDGVQDPGNMGSLMRSACAFGFDTVFIGTGSVDIYNDKVIRSSQGAIFKLNFLFGDVCAFVKSLNHKIYGTNVVNGIPLKEVKKEDKLAIILGNEGNGISKEVNALGLDNIFIPMRNTESLNVAVAGSIILYELGF